MYYKSGDRATQGALIIASQAPLDTWYDLITAPQLTDAILDRVVHNAYKIHLQGESMRKRQAALTPETCKGYDKTLPMRPGVVGIAEIRNFGQHWVY